MRSLNRAKADEQTILAQVGLRDPLPICMPQERMAAILSQSGVAMPMTFLKKPLWKDQLHLLARYGHESKNDTTERTAGPVRAITFLVLDTMVAADECYLRLLQLQ
jgi:hypothetical protein